MIKQRQFFYKFLSLSSTFIICI